MNKHIQVKLTVITCAFLLLFLQLCLCEKDCTGVDCPDMHDCIEEILHEDGCCTTCLRRGCTCEGYQYYDCINAGFKNGKVPEEESYFVDFGSTECSCPKGGGKIGCHFIPCPDIPANCIDLAESTEGCPHCLRIGCIYRNQRYEAGHSFHMDPCQVCHCPNDGGELMCSPIPDCDSEMVQKPVSPPDSEEKEADRNELHVTKPESTADIGTKYHHKLAENSLPLYTENTLESDELEDYDYLPETTSVSSSLAPVTPHSSPDAQSSHDGLHVDSRKELRESLGTYDTEYKAEETMPSPSPMVPTTTALPEGQTVASKKDYQKESPASELETAGGQTTQHVHTERRVPSRGDTHTFLDKEEERNRIPHTHRESHGTHHRGTGKHVKHRDADRKLHSNTTQYQSSQQHLTSPETQFSATTSPAVHVRDPESPRTSETMVQEEEEETNVIYAESEKQGGE